MRVVLGIEYDGQHFNGFEKQISGDTIQSRLESALSIVANQQISVTVAGRTDAGVHAVNQVVHFDCQAERNAHNWVLGANANLPSQICVKWAKHIEQDFHARFSAVERCYRYIIFNRSIRPSIWAGKVGWIRPRLDCERMHESARILLGEHDFSAFRAARCQAKNAVRNITNLSIYRQKQFIFLDISANAFLKHMVRNIMGTLLQVGLGKKDVNWVEQVLGSKDRRQAGPTADPNGLYFVSAKYPPEYRIGEMSVSDIDEFTIVSILDCDSMLRSDTG